MEGVGEEDDVGAVDHVDDEVRILPAVNALARVVVLICDDHGRAMLSRDSGQLPQGMDDAAGVNDSMAVRFKGNGGLDDDEVRAEDLGHVEPVAEGRHARLELVLISDVAEVEASQGDDLDLVVVAHLLDLLGHHEDVLAIDFFGFILDVCHQVVNAELDGTEAALSDGSDLLGELPLPEGTGGNGRAEDGLLGYMLLFVMLVVMLVRARFRLLVH